MKLLLVSFVHVAAISAALANVAPTPVVQSAAMRPGTTLMEVVYRVNDPDDATVKVRALAFVDGVRSFSKVLRPVTFVEGTAAKIGNSVPSNTNHTLTWDVGADWNIDLGQVKFEILARDSRGLLAFDWIAIPAAGAQPALKISKDTPSDTSVLNAFFWQYADGDPWLNLVNGVLTGSASSGVFANVPLVNGTAVQTYGAAYLFKRMNLDPAESTDLAYANTTARAGLLSPSAWHAVDRPYTGVSMVVAWGDNSSGQCNVPAGLNGVTAIAAGPANRTLALKSDGTVVSWGSSNAIPTGLSGVIAIADSGNHSVALKSDGTIVSWGLNTYGQTTVPTNLTGVTAIAAGNSHSLVLKNDGTVVAWGNNNYGQTTIPGGLTGVTAIAAAEHNLARKSDGTIVAWGYNGWGQTNIPAGLTGVAKVGAGYRHSLAARSDGTVAAWGMYDNAAIFVPAGLTGVIALAGGVNHSAALKNDGTVAVWGTYRINSVDILAAAPSGLNGVTSIASGAHHTVALRAKAP